MSIIELGESIPALTPHVSLTKGCCLLFASHFEISSSRWDIRSVKDLFRTFYFNVSHCMRHWDERLEGKGYAV